MDAPLDTPGPGVAARLLIVLWPAFLWAGVLEMVVFALVDPLQLHGLGIDAAAWPRGAVYTVAFGVFWAVIAASSALSLWLASPRWPD